MFGDQARDYKEAGAIATSNKAVEEIRNKALELLDSDDPIRRREFIRTYIERIEIVGANLTVYCTFGVPRCSRALVAGAGLEPATFGL